MSALMGVTRRTWVAIIRLPRKATVHAVMCASRWTITAGIVGSVLVAAPAATAVGTRTVSGGLPTPDGAARASLIASKAAPARLSLNVVMRVREPRALEEFIVAASTPGTPSYGHYLSPSAFEARFSPTKSNVASVETWLRAQGLKVTGVTKDRSLVHVRGTTAAIQNALKVSVRQYSVAGKGFYAADRSPSVPSNLPIAAVRGLSDYGRPQNDYYCTEPKHCSLTGPEFDELYDIKGTGEGQTIAFTMFGRALKQQSFETFALSTKTPLLTLGSGSGQIEFKQTGPEEPENESAQGEVALDSETAHAIAPKAHLLYFNWGAKAPGKGATKKEEEEDENEFFNNEELALDEAANSSASVISNSWGRDIPCEFFTAQQEKELNEAEASYVYAKAAALGKTFFFSSGDAPGWAPETGTRTTGAGGCGYPTSSSWVVSVGGSNAVTAEGSGIRTSSEYTDGSAGSNCSPYVFAPSWQTGIGTPVTAHEETEKFEAEHGVEYVSCHGGRAYPDVVADSCMTDFFNSGSVFDCGAFVGLENQSLYGYAGTSLSVPILAAGTAADDGENSSAGRPGLGFLAPLLYALGNDPNAYARDFYDITVGHNAYAAKTGWDQATGWGSPMFANLNSNESEITYTGPPAAFKGQATSVSAHLIEKGTATALPGRMVRFEAAGASCEGTTETAGNAACLLTPAAAGAGTVTAQFKGDGAYQPSSVGAPFSVSAEAEAEITYTGPEHTAKGQSTSLSAHLVEKGTAAALTGQKVRFEAAGTSCEATTEGAGKAECSITPAVAGAGKLTAQFAGASPYLPSSTSSHFAVWAKSSGPKTVQLNSGEFGPKAAVGSEYRMYGYEGWYLETPEAKKMGCAFDEVTGQLTSNTASKIAATLKEASGDECSGDWPEGATAKAELYNATAGEPLFTLSLSVKEKSSQLPVSLAAASNKKTYMKITFGSATCQYGFSKMQGHYWGPYPMYMAFEKQKLKLSKTLSTGECPKEALLTFWSSQWNGGEPFEMVRY